MLVFKPFKRLTHQEFWQTFKHSDGAWTPIAKEVLDTTSESSPGVLLRPLVKEMSPRLFQVDKTLKDIKLRIRRSWWICGCPSGNMC